MQPRAPLRTRLYALAIFGGGGLFMIVAISTAIYRGLQSDAWPAVEGTVISSTIKQDDSSEGQGTYRVHLRYNYTVGERTYEGWRYTSMGEFYTGNQEKAQKFQGRHQAGAKISIYYDAENPSDAVLVRGLDYRYWTLLGVGFVMIGFSAIVWWCEPMQEPPPGSDRLFSLNSRFRGPTEPT